MDTTYTDHYITPSVKVVVLGAKQMLCESRTPLGMVRSESYTEEDFEW